MDDVLNAVYDHRTHPSWHVNQPLYAGCQCRGTAEHRQPDAEAAPVDRLIKDHTAGGDAVVMAGTVRVFAVMIVSMPTLISEAAADLV